VKKKSNSSPKLTELRLKAEAKFSQDHPEGDPLLTDLDSRRLLHELQVHQIELEMQNEELRQARSEAEIWLERYTDLYEFAPVGLVTLSRDVSVRQVNLRGARLLGVDRSQLLGRPFGLFLVESDLPFFNTFIARIFESTTPQTCEVKLHNPLNPCWVQVEAIKVEDGNECHLVLIDIQARKQAEMKLQYLSMHDSLTGLYNRSYFVDSIEQIERGRHFPVSILMADVDNLKKTNDTQGHTAGDELLKRVAHVLTTAFRAEDIIARIGGDEFAVLLPDTDADAAVDALQRLSVILHEHNALKSTNSPLHLSYGISTAQYGRPLLEALKEADSLMYYHKRK
jgi:diguanylate cyclase (GGDEF)-like protein/PAS domain S-box-containing protein